MSVSDGRAYDLLKRVYDSGFFISDDLRHEIERFFVPSPLKVGQRVRHKKSGRCGVVSKISKSGQMAAILWDGQRWADGYTKIEMLEAVEDEQKKVDKNHLTFQHRTQ